MAANSAKKKKRSVCKGTLPPTNAFFNNKYKQFEHESKVYSDSQSKKDWTFMFHK